MKKRVSQYMVGNVCPTCNGMRLKREAFSVTFAALDIAEFSQMPLARVADLLAPIARGEAPTFPWQDVIQIVQQRSWVLCREVRLRRARKDSQDAT